MTAIGVIILLLDGTIQRSVIALTERLASRQLYTLSRAYTRILFRVNAKAYMYSTDQQKGKAEEDQWWRIVLLVGQKVEEDQIRRQRRLKQHSIDVSGLVRETGQQ